MLVFILIIIAIIIKCLEESLYISILKLHYFKLLG